MRDLIAKLEKLEGPVYGAVIASPFAAIWTAVPWPWAIVPVGLFLGFGAFAGACLLRAKEAQDG